MMTIGWTNGGVRFLDQTRLPGEEVYVETRDYRVIAEAIRSLRVRGAPAIGIAAAYGACLSVWEENGRAAAALRRDLETALAELAATRPTAVNLFHAVERIRSAAATAQSDTGDLRRAVLNEAKAIHEEDIDACRAMALHGASLLLGPSGVLTHCNAGALATGGEGTALGVIVEAHRQGKVRRVFVDETRPLLQGARLTAWELSAAGVPFTLITDNAAGAVMQKGEVQAVFVGADRIAANGDTANKVGTYSVAVLAHHHTIPFYVVAPVSTVDIGIRQGGEIPIEERDPREVTEWGNRIIAPRGTEVFSPAFDVTPNQLISAIVTEYGVLTPPFHGGLLESVMRKRADR
jgi:methylthioribose-1-phosphate isomerase